MGRSAENNAMAAIERTIDREIGKLDERQRSRTVTWLREKVADLAVEPAARDTAAAS